MSWEIHPGDMGCDNGGYVTINEGVHWIDFPCIVRAVDWDLRVIFFVGSIYAIHRGSETIPESKSPALVLRIS